MAIVEVAAQLALQQNACPAIVHVLTDLGLHDENVPNSLSGGARSQHGKREPSAAALFYTPYALFHMLAVELLADDIRDEIVS